MKKTQKKKAASLTGVSIRPKVTNDAVKELFLKSIKRVPAKDSDPDNSKQARLEKFVYVTDFILKSGSFKSFNFDSVWNECKRVGLDDRAEVEQWFNKWIEVMTQACRLDSVESCYDSGRIFILNN